MNRRSAEESKKNILAAALTVFSEHGYRDACMRMIAQRAGMSVGGLYLHFKSKEDLCLTMMRERMEELAGELESTINKDRPDEAIVSYIRINLDYAKRHRELILTHSRDQGFTFGASLKREYSKKQRGLIEEILITGIGLGRFVECDVTETSKIIMGILRGYVFSMLVDPENLFSTDECTKFVMAALSRENGSHHPG
jgi:AcrR family transcriptional regulator